MFDTVARAGAVDEVDDPCRHGVPAWLCDEGCEEEPDEPPDPVADAGPVVDPEQVPGARLALACQAAGAVPALLSDAQVLDVVEGAEKIVRWAEALRTRMLAEFADRHPTGTWAAAPGADPAAVAPVSGWVPDEVGLTLGVSRLEALGEIAAAQRFAHVLPDTLDAWEQGRIDGRRADAIARATAVLPEEKARAVEAAILPNAPDATLRQVRDRLRRAVARVDPDGEFRRHRAAATERRVSIRSLDEGMASLWFYGPADQIEAAWQMGDRLARALGPEDPRTLDQRRFDLAVQVLQGRLTVTDLSDAGVSGDPAGTGSTGTERTAGSPDERGSSATDAPCGTRGASAAPAAPAGHRDPPPGAGVPPDVLTEAVVRALAQRPDPHATVHKPLIHVVVGLDTLLGAERPAELVGHGPIDATAARALAAGGTWARLVTDPLSGTLLDHGRTRYTPRAGLADHVRARDQICRGPQCTRSIRDLDHHRSWADGGATSEANLYGLCRHHHMLKDAPGWHVIAHPDRSLTWLSPHGRRHTTAPYDYRRFTDSTVDTDSAVGTDRTVKTDSTVDTDDLLDTARSRRDGPGGGHQDGDDHRDGDGNGRPTPEPIPSVEPPPF